MLINQLIILGHLFNRCHLLGSTTHFVRPISVPLRAQPVPQPDPIEIFGACWYVQTDLPDLDYVLAIKAIKSVDRQQVTSLLVGKASFLFSPFLCDSTVISLNQILFVFSAVTLLPWPGNTANLGKGEIRFWFESKKDRPGVSWNSVYYLCDVPVNLKLL